MKKIAVFVLALLCVVALVGCSPAYTEGSVLLKEGTVKRISVTSDPEAYAYSYTGKDAQAIVDYLSSLDLTENSGGNDADGGSWEIVLEYKDGSTVVLYHSGNKVITVSGGSQYKMIYEQASAFDSLLDELNGNK